MRKITDIIVHCSATPEGKPFTVADIDRWHRQRGFDQIGYHFVVYLDGTIHQGRPIAKIGAHCQKHNANSIGVCYIGGCTSDNKRPKDTRTPEQKLALIELLKHLKQQFPKAAIHGHRDYAAKACPSFDAKKEYANI